MSKIAKLPIFLLVFICTNTVAAESIGANTTNIGTDKIVQMIITLVVIIAVILFISFILKRTVLFRNKIGNNKLRVISSLPVGTKERVVLLEAQNKKMLVGITGSTINLLHVFKDDEAADEGTPSDQ